MEAEAGEIGAQAPAATTSAPAPAAQRRAAPAISSARLAMAQRATELARLDVLYLRHDLRNVGIIAVLMLAAVIGLSFALH